MKEFLLSDEQENSYRFVVRTSGINLSRFNSKHSINSPFHSKNVILLL